MALKIKNKQDTKKLSKKISDILSVGDVLTLRGELGVGKTALARDVINNLSKSNTDVTSPTFNLLQIYDTSKGEVHHFDLYRVKNIEEIYELGIEDSFANAITIIEWPELAENILPNNIIDIELSYGNSEEERVAKIVNNGRFKNTDISI